VKAALWFLLGSSAASFVWSFFLRLRATRLCVVHLVHRRWCEKEDYKLDAILLRLAGLKAQGENMATKEDVTAAVQAISDKVDAAKTALDDEIARVEALIAAGGTVTPADLQTIVDNLNAVGTKVDAVTGEAARERP
jgi:hypothetical protein